MEISGKADHLISLIIFYYLKRGGAMLVGMSSPGFHMMIPFITSGNSHL